MAKAKNTAGQSFTLKYAAQVKVTAPELQLLPSLKYLDAEALSRAPKVTIDVGYFKAPCCERHVRATIEAGVVTSLELDRCSDRTPVSPDLAAFLKAALKRARLGVRAKWKPVPIWEFLASAQEIAELETLCITFVIFGRTYFCCRTDDRDPDCVQIDPITLPLP